MDERDERLIRAVRRAGYHLVKAVFEVLTAVSVLLEELNAARTDAAGSDRTDGDGAGARHIPVE